MISPSKKYHLVFQQQPREAPSSGFGGEKPNRRALNPCPIVQLGVERDGEVRFSLEEIGDATLFLVTLNLLSEDLADRNIVQVRPLTAREERAFTPEVTGHAPTGPSSALSTHPQRETRRVVGGRSTTSSDSGDASATTPVGALMAEGEHSLWERNLFGCLVSASNYLNNLNGEKGVYFIFPDVAIRVPGRFRLRADLYGVESLLESGNTTMPSTSLASAVSDSFVSLPYREAETLKGGRPVSVSKHFASQGVRMPVSKYQRRKTDADQH